MHARPLGILFLAALVALAAPRATLAAGDPIELPAIISLTGPGSFLGKAEQSAFSLVQDQVNKSGGIAGRPVSFTIQDDQSNPQVAVSLTNALIARKVPVIFGSSLVGACNAMAPLVKDGPLVYCLSAGMHPERGTYVFTYSASTTELIAVNVRYLRDRGLKRIAILTSIDASGQDGEHGIDAALAAPDNAGMTVVAREHYNVSDLSVAAQISRIKESGAQALIAWGTGTPIGTVFHGIQDSGLDIPVSVSASNLLYVQMKAYANILPKEMISAGLPCIALDSLPAGAVKTAVSQYIDAFKAVGIRADLSQSIAWDPALIVLSAFKKYGANATAAQIKDYVSTLHGFAGANGMYDFRTGDQRGLTAATSGIMVRWDPAKDTWVAISKFGGSIK